MDNFLFSSFLPVNITGLRVCRLILLAICLFVLEGIIAANSEISGNTPDLQTALNGKSIAFAYPVSHIVVDGSGSDWPGNTPRYPMTNIFGKKPAGKADIAAYFQVGYNSKEEALYFLVTVSDDSYITDSSGISVNSNQDFYSLYLDSRNLPSGSGVSICQLNEKWKNIKNPEESWDPEVQKGGVHDVVTGCKHNGSETIYECRIVLKDRISAGRSLGIDHSISDKDADDTGGSGTILSWGDQEDKDSSPGKLGYVVLMKANEAVGTITGRMEWENPVITGFPSRIRVTSVKKPGLQVQVPVDSTGKYSVSLPQGTYEVTPVWSLRVIQNDYYKIDRTISRVTVKTAVNKTVAAPILMFKTLPEQDLLPQKGVLFDFDDKKALLLDDFIRKYQEYYEIPGVSLALIKDGQVIYHKDYGVKNTFTNEPVNKNTLFEAASVTKTVFAFAVNSLAEKGIINLDRPLYEYLPFEEIAYDDRYKLMTARHVLSHQTGLPNWAYNMPDGRLILKFAPGTGYGYSGEGFEYLKRVVVKITGKDIESVLKDEVLEPLGLKNFYFSKNDYLAKVVANGHYDNLPTRSDLPDSPGMAWSMYTEALSFSSYVISLLDRKVLKPATYNEMFSIQDTVPPDEDEKKRGLEIFYGLGIKLEKTPFGAEFEHGGNNGDFKCQFKMYTDLNMGYVIFTNSNTGGKLAYDGINRFLITGKGNR